MYYRWKSRSPVQNMDTQMKFFLIHIQKEMEADEFSTSM